MRTLLHSTEDIFVPFYVICTLLAIILFHPKTFFYQDCLTLNDNHFGVSL